MRVAIVSDIHANLQAWRAVRDDLLRRNVDTVVCLGDIVGYGPNPAEVLAYVRETCPNIILGNHDAAAAGILDLDIFSEGARRSAAWTIRQLSDDDRSALAALPLTIEDGDVLYTHADCSAPDQWGYVETIENARAGFAAVANRLVFLGHTHFPEAYCCAPDGNVTQGRHASLKLEPESRYIINVGSVGDPRDETALASYVIYDDDTQRIEFHPVEFNVDGFARAIAAIPELATPWFLKRRAHATAAGEREHAVKIIRAPASPMGSGGRAKVRLTTGQLRTMSSASLKNIGTPKAPAAEPAKKPASPRAWPIVAGVVLLAAAACTAIYFSSNPGLPALTTLKKIQPLEPAATTVSNAGTPLVAASPPPATGPWSRDLMASEAKLTGKLLLQVNGGMTNVGFWASTAFSMSWTFTANNRAVYDLSIVSATPPGAGGTYTIDYGRGTLRATTPGTASWYVYATNKVGQITLDVGTNTITVKAEKFKGALMNLERVRLRPAGAE